MPRNRKSITPSPTNKKSLDVEDLAHGKVLLPQRQKCSCEVTKHVLIGNCLYCGRIVCEQEGSGPCFTCSHLVCTKEEQEILHCSSEGSDALYKKLLGESLSFKNVRNFLGIGNSTEMEKAVAHKNRLLDFDKTVERRTKVIDDQGDYFNPESNRWLTPAQKEALIKKEEEVHEARHGHRKASKMTFDFAGRTLIEEDEESLDDIDELLKDDTSIFNCPGVSSPREILDYKPEYLESKPMSRATKLVADKRKVIRLQDEELQYMTDGGMCLSVQQPYASLIVEGIKKHEGRNWYTSFRGRLWIHSGSKVPSTEERAKVEKRYHQITGATEFPQNYPPGCLLGCVDLINCLDQEEYSEQFPHGECGSAHVFILENSKAMEIQIPMKGRGKIFKMEYKFHDAAKKMLKKR